MPNVFKYSVGATGPGCLYKGGFMIGNNTADYGGTFYTGIAPGAGGYTIYLNKASQGPSIYAPSSDSALISLTNTQIAGSIGSPAGYTTAAQCLNYFAGQTGKVCVNRDYEGIVTSGLVLNVDAGYTPSYPTTGTTLYDLSGGGNDETLTNGPTFDTGNSGSIVFDGVDDYGVIANSSSINLTGSLTISSWIYPYSVSGWIAVMYKNSQSNNGGYHMGIDPSGYLQGGIRYNSSWVTVQSATNQLQINTWQQICMSIDFTSQILTLYKNGVSIKEQTNFNYTLAGNTTSLYIGSNASFPSELYRGRISLSQIYNRALSATEVLQNYNAQKSRFGL